MLRFPTRSSGNLLAATGLLLATVCGPPTSSDPGAGPDGLQVHRGRLEDRFLLSGELQALHSHQLITPRTQQWTATVLWLAPEGHRVSVGDPVVQFDTTAVSTEREDKSLAVAEAEQELERTRLDLEAAQLGKALEVRRQRVARDKARLEAVVPPSLLPDRDYQDRQMALERAQAALEQAIREEETSRGAARHQIGELEVRLRTTRRDLEWTESAIEALTLRAPVAGVLLHGTHPWEGRKFQEGDTLYPGFVAAEVPELSAMSVMAHLSDVDEGEITAGMPVRCRMDTYPERSFPGLVREVAEFAQELSYRSSRRAFTVHVELDETDPEVMRPGMSVQVEVLRKRWNDVLIVPRVSLELEGPQPQLVLADGSRVEVDLTWCGPVDCVLATGPPEGTALGRAG